MSKLVNRINAEAVRMIIEITEGKEAGIEVNKSNQSCFPTIEEVSEACVRMFPVYADAFEKILSEKE
jgi:hypothetical protein